MVIATLRIAFSYFFPFFIYNFYFYPTTFKLLTWKLETNGIVEWGSCSECYPTKPLRNAKHQTKIYLIFGRSKQVCK